MLVRAPGLTKRFGDFTAVDGIDFDLYRGEAFGFLGANGAGKSSTMRMIGCVSPPSGGELNILGTDPVRDGSAIRARIGVVPQDDTLDVELTVVENLLVYGRYFGLPRRIIRERTAALLEFVQLADRAGDKVEPLSGGLRRRLTIARSLINEPEILILDEPTTDLAPPVRPRVRLLADGVPADLAVQHLVQRARSAVLSGRDRVRPRLPGGQARDGEPGRGELPGLRSPGHPGHQRDEHGDGRGELPGVRLGQVEQDLHRGAGLAAAAG